MNVPHVFLRHTHYIYNEWDTSSAVVGCGGNKPREREIDNADEKKIITNHTKTKV